MTVAIDEGVFFPLPEWAISSTTDVPFYLELAETVSGDILEIGAGVGRISTLLASVNKRVVAMDTYVAALRLAQRNWDEGGGGRGPWYLAGDVRNLCLSCTFDLILATNRSFERLLLDAERVRVFRDCAAMLNPGGLLVVHAWSVPTDAGGLSREKVEEHPSEDRQITLQIVRREVKEPARKVRRYSCCLKPVNGEKGPREFPPLELRGYSPTELDSLGLRVGLHIENRYANFQKKPFTPGAAELVWVYRK